MINEEWKTTYVIHIVADISWWRPSWKRTTTGENNNIPIIFSKMFFIVSTITAKYHIPNISTLRDWKWLLSFTFWPQYCRMAAILENGCHSVKMQYVIDISKCSPWCLQYIPGAICQMNINNKGFQVAFLIQILTHFARWRPFWKMAATVDTGQIQNASGL